LEARPAPACREADTITAPSQESIERALLAPEEAPGWSPRAVAAWLFARGRHLVEPTALTEALCLRLLEAGAPVWRVRVSFRTLHPLFVARSFTWFRGARAVAASRPHGIERSEDYIGSPIQHVFETGTRARHRLDVLDPDAHPVLHEVRRQGGVDYAALPLVFSTGRISAFVVATDRAGGFTQDDLAKLEALAGLLAPVLEVLATREMAQSLLNTYVGPRTGGKILNGLVRRGDGERIHAVIWFSDLRDSTRLTEALPPWRMLALLNDYFELVAAAVSPRGGEILRFIGDAMLIVFPCESPESTCAAADAAVDAAVDAFDSLGPLNHRRQRAGEPLIRFGLGLHVGEVTYGNVGAPERLDFTVVGRAVNRAARIEALTKALGEPLLMSAELAGAISRPVRALGAQPLDGVAGAQPIFTLRGGAHAR